MIYNSVNSILEMKIIKAKHISNLLLCNYLKTLWLETIIYSFPSEKFGGAVQGWQKIWAGFACICCHI